MALLAVLAFARVGTLAAAYPFFTNVDEHRHVDMVRKYASGALPHPERSVYDPAIGTLLALYGSPEYVLPRGRPGPRPVWELTPAERTRRIAFNERPFAKAENLETFQSPAYYALAGAWLAFGRVLGLDGAAALYWVRGLGALGLASLVVAAGALLRRTHPDDAVVRLGVPALLAAVPTDVLFYTTGDSLSLALGGLAFAGIAWLAFEPRRSPGVWAAVGVALALAFLAKATNVVALGAAGLLAVLVAREAGVRRLGALAIGCGVPLLLWVGRCLWLTGSALGTGSKVAGLGWGLRPWSEAFGHPLFTPSGVATFLVDLVPMFWRGEVVWHREVLALPFADAVYGVTTAVFGVAAAWAVARRSGSARRVEALAGIVVVGSVAVLAVLSLRFVFHATSNPPASHPYFIQGRLVSGAWLAFALVYVRGLVALSDALAGRVSAAAARGLAWALLAGVLAVCVASELWLAAPVFGSPYNLYHVPAAP